MTAEERDAEVKALRSQLGNVKGALAELEAIDVSKEIGDPPTMKGFMAARQKLDAISARVGGGGKLSRSETVTVRLDPKLRYLADLAARLHRRTLSSYIEWSIKEVLDSEELRNTEDGRETFGTEAEYLWDVDEADRFARLALRYPHLLTHEEQVRWKLVRECGYLWRGSYANVDNEWRWRVAESALLFDRLRSNWELFCAVANGDRPVSDLPTWSKSKGGSSVKPSFDDLDDDIPF